MWIRCAVIKQPPLMQRYLMREEPLLKRLYTKPFFISRTANGHSHWKAWLTHAVWDHESETFPVLEKKERKKPGYIGQNLIQHDTIKYDTVRYDTIWCNAVENKLNDKILYGTIRCVTTFRKWEHVKVEVKCCLVITGHSLYFRGRNSLDTFSFSVTICWKWN